MISHQHKFIYIHINHCGGSAVEDALASFGEAKPARIDNITRDDILDSQLPIGATQHLTALELKKFYGDDLWSEYYTFTFVANPFDRIVTAYLQRGRPFFGHRNLLDFLKGPYCNTSEQVPDGFPQQAYSHARVKRMVSSSYSWLSDENGALLDLDFIGRKESLSRDFQEVIDKLGLETRLGRANKTPRKRHYSTYHNEETRRWVEERMADDLDHFGYSFEHRKSLWQRFRILMRSGARLSR
jgi:hypothetical protein